MKAKNLFHRFHSFYFSILGMYSIAALLLLLINVQLLYGQGKWGIYHYFIGAKYLKEIGYFSLYSCSLEANSQKFTDKSQPLVRNLYSYTFVAPSQLPPCPRHNFTQARWNEFKADITIITSGLPPKYWSEVITDKGFNPPPFWAAFANTVANLFPLHHSTIYFFLFKAEFLFIFLTVMLIYYKSGYKLALVTTFLILLYPGTFGAINNSYFQFIWFPLLVFSISMWQKNKPIIAGVALALASALQAFPALFLVPIVTYAVISWVKKKKEATKFSSTFIVSFISTVLFCVVVSTVYFGKPTIWQEWYTKITIHKNYISGEVFNIGFPNLVATIATNRHTVSNNYISDYIPATARNKKLQLYSPFINILSFVFLAAVIVLQWRNKSKSQFIYGYFFIYMLLSLSPYYYLTVTLLPFIVANESLAVRRYVLCGIICLFALRIGYISFDYVLNLINELALFIFYCGLALTFYFQKNHPAEKKSFSYKKPHLMERP